MGANATKTTQDQSAFPFTPAWLTPYWQGGAQQAEAAQGQLPNISQLYQNIPLLNIPGLNRNERSDISQFQQNIGPNAGYLTGQAGLAQSFNPNQPYGQSVQGLESFMGTAGRPSNATRAALREFKDLQAPEILQQSALMGQGNSGAADAALAQGQEQALVPFLQQDLQNQLMASGQLGQLGLAEQGQQAGIAGQEAQLGLSQEAQTQQSLQNALQAAGIPREIATQRAQALYQQLQQRQQYASGVQQGPLSTFANLIGQFQKASGSVTGPKF